MNNYILNIEPNLKVVGTINKLDIKGDVPKDAQYCVLNPTNSFIQKFYKFEEVKFNDNTTSNIFKFWGEQGGWHNSSYNVNLPKLNDMNFLKVV